MKIKKIISAILAGSMATVFLPVSASSEEINEISTVADGYSLVWNDEFDGNEVDMSKWSYELGNWKLDESGGYITDGWGNNEQEFYTDKNASVSDGVLTIAARKENYTDEIQGNYDYTSSRLSSQHKFSTCGGRIEVRAKCDSGKSLWPAIWMLPEDSVYGGWAASGEIDIMEGWGSTPEKVCGTIHFGDVWPNNTYLTSNYNFQDGDSIEKWHTYSIEWDKDEMRWYVDDDLYSKQSDWYSVNRPYPAPFDQNFYIILNCAIGGHFDGVDGIYADPQTFSDGEKHFDIDYVRVYDKVGDDFAPTPVSSISLGSYIENADASITNKDGCSVIHIENVGSLEYGIIGLIRAKKVSAGEKWTLEFDVSSTAEREMIVTAEDSEYTRYIDKKITVSPDEQHYSFDLTLEEDISVDLKFQLGNIGNAASIGTHDVTISNIKWILSEKEDASYVKGDVNSDGVFNIADVATLQKWLLCDSFNGDDIKLNNWKAADLCNDGKIDVFDLCLMKQELLDSGEIVRIPSLEEISRMSSEEATELFSPYTFQDIECIWGKFEFYYSGLYGGWWEIGNISIELVFDYYTQKLDWVTIAPLPTEDEYIRSFIRQRINFPDQTVEQFTSTIYSTEQYDLKNRVTSITVYGVDGEIMTSGEVRAGVAKTVVVCYDEDKRLEFEVIY